MVVKNTASPASERKSNMHCRGRTEQVLMAIIVHFKPADKHGVNFPHYGRLIFLEGAGGQAQRTPIFIKGAYNGIYYTNSIYAAIKASLIDRHHGGHRHSAFHRCWIHDSKWYGTMWHLREQNISLHDPGEKLGAVLPNQTSSSPSLPGR